MTGLFLCVIVFDVILTSKIGVRANDIYLTGVGASFPQEVYQTWASAFENIRRKFVNVNVYFIGTGSGGANEEILAAENETKTGWSYLASELSVNSSSKDKGLKSFPIISGAVVLGYNLPGVDNLNLTMDAVVGIYNGSIKWWDDPSIANYNRNAQLPRKRIRPCARIDQSGTTYIFTAALAYYSTPWRETYGKFDTGFRIESGEEIPVRWPRHTVKLIGKTNRAVSGIILSYAYSLGYLAVSEAVVAHISYANIVGDNGAILPLRSKIMQTAMSQSYGDLASSEDLTLDLVEHVPQGSYPMIGYSYIMTNTEKVADCTAAREFLRYIDWILTDSFPEKEAGDFYMAVPPSNIKELVRSRVLRYLYCGGQNLTELIERQKYDELLSTQDWRLPVIIISPIVGVIILGLIGYMAWQQLKLRNAILSDDWKIASSSIKLIWSRKWGNYHQEPGSAPSMTITAASVQSLAPSLRLAGVGVWKGQQVCLRDLHSPTFQVSQKETKRSLIRMRDSIHHINVLRFFGVTHNDEGHFLVSEYAPKGTLSDVVQNDKYRIDDNIKFSLAIDVACGVGYLHEQGIIHGMLTPECCLIDNKWNIKISEWEHSKLEWVCSARKKSQIMPVLNHESSSAHGKSDPNILARSHFWVCPEMLKSNEPNKLSKKPGDVYSFSMLLVEIFTREDPYSELSGHMEPVEIVERITRADMRPSLSLLNAKAEVAALITEAWSVDPTRRPTFQNIVKVLKATRPSKKSVMDCMMETLEGYIGNLEGKVEERTAELASANRGLENLLHQILPPTVAESLANGQSVPPEQFDSVTIYFSDIVGFTALSEASSPMEVVNMLNDLYLTFDFVIDRHDVYKVETIGDAYMVISGLPKRNGIIHAMEISTMALDLMAAVQKFKIRHKPDEPLLIRAGIHSGPVVAGVVGSKMPRYCLFGDTVNTASRMESTSKPMKIQVSHSTQQLLAALGSFQLELRGQVAIKGKGSLTTYFLLGRDGYQPREVPITPTTKNAFFSF